MGTFDGTGGAVTTHVFGAFFGLACTAVASPKGAASDPDCKGRYQSDIFSLFGSLMIWAYYPVRHSHKSALLICVNLTMGNVSSRTIHSTHRPLHNRP